MSTYYLIAAPGKLQYIDPSKIYKWIGGMRAGGGVKHHQVIRGPAANALMALLMPGEPWNEEKIQLVGDGGDDYDHIKETWKDVTRDAVRLLGSGYEYVEDDDEQP